MVSKTHIKFDLSNSHDKRKVGFEPRYDLIQRLVCLNIFHLYNNVADYVVGVILSARDTAVNDRLL